MIEKSVNGFWRTEKLTEQDGFISPYRFFSAEDWETFRADTPLTLSEDEVRRLRSMNDPISLEEVERIYLAISRLLYSHVEAAQHLYAQRQDFLQFTGNKTPFIIGVAGPVAVGKSTTARILKELLARWPSSPKVDLVTTDGFLKPNAQLLDEDIMDKKGFPESYDVAGVLRFLSSIKAGEPRVTAPSYSHFIYDVLPDQEISVDRPDILIFEGINVLQPRDMPREGDSIPLVSDYFDFAIYIDPGSYFHRYSQVSAEEALETAIGLWRDINLVNLKENIQPTRPRADLVLRKGKNHLVERVALRKL